ncbi:MAG: radical SAM protein [Deltaproteobacteria bacterium]|nr:radical SAM protein [Deltaproteobacteria bacterium]
MKRTVSFSKRSKNIFFHILTHCNLKCGHCYINKAQHGSSTLPLATVSAWLQVFTGSGADSNLVLLGGEPTLHPDLPRIVKTARSKGCTSITIDTNGYLFNDILEKVEPGDVDFFSFSLDGPTPDENDPIRGRGSFDTCVAGIKAAKQKGFNTSLIYTVSSGNLQGLQGMVPLLKALAVDRFFIQVIGLRGNASAFKHDAGKSRVQQVAGRDWLDVIPAVAQKIADFGITVTYPKVYLGPEEAFECAGVVAENYFIFPNGRVYRCPLCEDFPVHGLVFENDILKKMPPINETDLFQLDIPEGCVMNKMIQPDNIAYHGDGRPKFKIACCLLKEEISEIM